MAQTLPRWSRPEVDAPMTGAGLGCAVRRRTCLCWLDPCPGHGLPSTLLQPSSARHKLSLVTPPNPGVTSHRPDPAALAEDCPADLAQRGQGHGLPPLSTALWGPVSPACWPSALKIRARPASPWDTLRIQGPSGRAACLQAFQQALPWAAVPASSSSLPVWGLLSHIQCRVPQRSESLWPRTPHRRVSAKTRNTPRHNRLLDFSQKKTKSTSECSLVARSQFLSPRVQWFFSNCIWGGSGGL